MISLRPYQQEALQSINDFCVSLELQTYQTHCLYHGLINLLEGIIEVEEIK
jgi:hypothetical protein